MSTDTDVVDIDPAEVMKANKVDQEITDDMLAGEAELPPQRPNADEHIEGSPVITQGAPQTEPERIGAAAPRTEPIPGGNANPGGDIEAAQPGDQLDEGVEAPQPGPQAGDAVQPEDDLKEVLFGDGEAVEWVFGPDGHQIALVQRELGFFAKQELMGLVGKMIDEAMAGPNGLTLQNLFEVPESVQKARRDPSQVSVSDFRDADLFVQALGKLISYVPKHAPEMYCIILGVPDYKRDDVQDILALPDEEGGLGDEDGADILHIFLEQNYVGLTRFFREFVGGLQKRLEKVRRDAEQQSSQSKPSRRSRRSARRR